MTGHMAGRIGEASLSGGCCPIMDVDRQADGSPIVDAYRLLENLDAGGELDLEKRTVGVAGSEGKTCRRTGFSNFSK